MTAETITDYLIRMQRKAVDKGEHPSCGARSTKEVAEHFGMTVSAARTALWKLFHEGRVSADPEGITYLWTIADPAE